MTWEKRVAAFKNVYRSSTAPLVMFVIKEKTSIMLRAKDRIFA